MSQTRGGVCFLANEKTGINKLTIFEAMPVPSPSSHHLVICMAS